jgi:L-2-hydroxyglutarate oxidase LhgO
LDEIEEQRLHELFTRATANSVPGVRMVGPDELMEIEPNAVGRAALHSPFTAVVDYSAITTALIGDLVASGGRIVLDSEAQRIDTTPTAAIVHTSKGEVRADHVIVCAGAQSDRIAHRSDGAKDPAIIPFFGQYYLLEARYRNILNGLVYPVPDPKYPFLGVHLTKRFDGEMTIGPNAFISLSRESYRGLGLNPRDFAEVMGNPGFWRFAMKNLPAAARETRSVLSKSSFIRQAQRYVPALEGASVTRLTRGIRAQAMDGKGRLIDDFAIEYAERVIHLRNAPSPGATSSMAIAEYLVASMWERYDMA